MKYAALILVVIAIIAIVSVVSLYGGGEQPEENMEVKVALLINSGPGESYTELVESGIRGAVQLLRDDDIEVKWTATYTLGPADAGVVAEGYVAEGYDLIVDTSALYKDTISDLAERYPDTNFLGHDYEEEAILTHNVSGSENPTWRAGYLNGIVAAGITKTGKIGYLTGYKYPSTIMGYNTFRAGAKRINPDVQIFFIEAGSWVDVAQCRLAIKPFEIEGVDVIWVWGIPAPATALAAEAKEADFYALMSMCDLHELAPNHIPAGDIWRCGAQFVDAITDMVNKEYGNKIYEAHLYSDSSEYRIYMPDVVPDEIEEEIDTVLQELEEGTLELPRDSEFPAGG